MKSLPPKKQHIYLDDLGDCIREDSVDVELNGNIMTVTKKISFTVAKYYDEVKKKEREENGI